MRIEYMKRLPTPQEIMLEIPLKEKFKEVKKQRDDEIQRIFEGKDKRFILIIGPCSADNEDSVCEYLSRLVKIQEQVKDSVLIIPRVYTNKPRTTGEGYKGMAHQPDPTKEPDLLEGLKAIRSLHMKALCDYRLPAADEMLYPENYSYLKDILSYVAIGARSVENQQHRLVSSGVCVPVGMKNPTCGDISVMLNSINAAQLGHTFIYNGFEVETSGNPLAHAILRGAVDSYGKNIPNYHYENLISLAVEYEKQAFSNPSIIVDTNHANSMKDFRQQPRIAREILASRKFDSTLKNMVKGLMVESYIEEGKQNIGDNIFGKSITDPCLGWEETEKLIYYVAENA